MVEYEEVGVYKTKYLTRQIDIILAKSPHNNETNADMSIYRTQLKLKDNTIIWSLVEEKSYTETEVKNFIKRFCDDHPLHRGMQIIGNTINDWWIEQKSLT